MEKLSMCRICLVEDVKMYSLISANLQEMYERLTDMPFVTNDKKPVQVCYLCRARLQNCHRLQDTCLKSEEFFNKVMANNELKQMESQDLNTLKTVHPLIRISCVPSMREDPDDDTSDEDNNIQCDPLEITSDDQVNHQIFKGTLAAKNPKIDLLNGNSESTISIDISESEVTVLQNKNIVKKIQTIGRAVIVENKNIVKQVSFIDNYIKKRNMETCNDTLVYENILRQKPDLTSHTRKHMGENAYECDVCEKSFTRKATLINHIRIHTGEKPYNCITCNQSFSRKCYLVRHTRKHMGINTYKCDVCEKSFNRRPSLVLHLRLHTGEKPYKCFTCNRSFSKRSNFVAHTRIHTGERPYRCDVCEKSFNQRSHLVKHKNIHWS